MTDKRIPRIAQSDEIYIDPEFGRASFSAQAFFLQLREKVDTGQNRCAIPSTIKRTVFPFNSKFTEAVIAEAFNEVWQRKFLYFYPNKGTPYFHISKWGIDENRPNIPMCPEPSPGDATAGWNPFATADAPAPAPPPKYRAIVLDAWNAEGIIKHEKFPSDAATVLKNLIKEFDLDAVLKGIKVYGEVRRRKEAFFNFRWTLSEFLRRKGGCRVFMYKTVEDYLTDAEGRHNAKSTSSGRTFAAQREQEGKFDD